MKTLRHLFAGLGLALFAVVAQAQFSPQQIATLKTACNAAPACVTLANAADDIALAEWFNTTDAAYIVWKPSVTKDEIQGSDAYDWTRVDNLTAGKARIWESMFDNASRSINPSKANIRAGIDASWVGTAADLAVRAAVYAQCKRGATRAEKALASGAGTTNAPSTMTWVGPITYADASLIRS